VTDTVCVLDANQRSALAVVRSLGKRALRVIAADDCEPTLAGSSRYCAGSFTYPSPYEDPDRFIRALGEELAQYGCSIVLPMTDLTTLLLARFREMLPGIQLPIANLDTLETFSDKWELYQIATKLNLPTPKTYRLDPAELLSGSTHMAFPFVLKPARSQTQIGSEWLRGSVHYISSPSDIPNAFATDTHLARIPYLVQQYIPGHGQGIFALFDRGRPVAFFAHKRLREKPPTGGVSVLSESIPLDPRLLSISKVLLGSVPWHGVAMVEFKTSSDGLPYLIEVNPRFWGSLQLAIDAGVDFPWLLYQLAAGTPVDAPQEYKTAIRCRWILGDLDSLYLTLRSDVPFARKLRSVLDFFTPSLWRTRHEVNRLEDLRPFFFELRHYLLARPA
jgi:predicted ATP-grasp superfamily ATP-dependent carboligase